MAESICIEQTIEFPPDLVRRADILERIVAEIESFEPLGPERFEATIAFAVETVGGELPQLLNVLFGNTSLKPGVRLERIEPGAALAASFRGPRFGREGLRALTSQPEQPLLCTALKPMGLAPDELADLAYRFALGGIDVIKDDHGLADQPFCPFSERVKRCAEAVRRGRDETGKPCLYVPNLSMPTDRLRARALEAKQAGAGGLLVAPALVGFDSMRMLADDDAIALPILCHPALQGLGLGSPDGGIGHRVWLAELPRLAGADAIIFPSYGGRFAFTEEDCRDLVDGTACEMGAIRTIMPVPAGGMSVDKVPAMLSFYGRDMMLLIGGDLHRDGSDLAASCRRFREVVQSS
jgi:ribulose-bisphosphate carboxylase large chain